MLRRWWLIVLVMAALPAVAQAQKSTVCSITVNSADEREAMRAALPSDKYDFVELVERGRPDWLASACRRGVKCDVLVVSGHFAGTEFYTSKFDRAESLPIEEVERAVCSESCPGVFASLKEVYLFGCDTLKPDPVRSSTPEVVRGLVRAGATHAEAEKIARAMSERHGESSRALMRQIFAGVPVIYGFATFAPFGKTAGPMLARHLQSDASTVGSGRTNAALLARFSNTGMVVTDGLPGDGPDAGASRDACRYVDDRLTPAQKLRAVHEVLARDGADVRMAFPRIEKHLASQAAVSGDAALIDARVALATDRNVSARFTALIRATDDPALRLRMIETARMAGWFAPPDATAERARLVRDLVAQGDVGYGEVDLVCSLNRDRELDVAKVGLGASNPSATGAASSAALACLGSGEARGRVVKALASADEGEVRIAQAYFRHQPLATPDEQLAAARAISRMKASSAQVRALETLGRHHLADRAVLEELTALYARTRSVETQRAVAEALLRADRREIATPALASHLKLHRVRASVVSPDVIDALLERLQTASDKG